MRFCLGEFRSKDTAMQCIQKLGEHNFFDLRFFQTGDTPFEGINTMENAYAGELPLSARGTPGSDIAVEGRAATPLYDKEALKKIMGDDTKLENAYIVAVNITNLENPDDVEDVMEIFRQYGADVNIVKIKEIKS